MICFDFLNSENIDESGTDSEKNIHKANICPKQMGAVIFLNIYDRYIFSLKDPTPENRRKWV